MLCLVSVGWSWSDHVDMYELTYEWQQLVILYFDTRWFFEEFDFSLWFSLPGAHLPQLWVLLTGTVGKII